MLTDQSTEPGADECVDGQFRDACPPQSASDPRVAVQKCFAQGGLSFQLKNVSQVYPRDTRCTKSARPWLPLSGARWSCATR